MRRIITAAFAALAILASSTPASAEDFNIIVTRSLDCGAHTVTITASGYGLAIDDRFKLVAGFASTTALVTHPGGGAPAVTATFASAAVGENGTSIVRTRYDGYLRAGAQQSPGSPYVAAELISYRTC